MTISTMCSDSDCREAVTISTISGTVTAVRPSNGIRGSRHIAAQRVTTEVYGTPEETGMWMWDCPLCEYADSYEPGE